MSCTGRQVLYQLSHQGSPQSIFIKGRKKQPRRPQKIMTTKSLSSLNSFLPPKQAKCTTHTLQRKQSFDSWPTMNFNFFPSLLWKGEWDWMSRWSWTILRAYLKPDLGFLLSIQLTSDHSLNYAVHMCRYPLHVVSTEDTVMNEALPCSCRAYRIILLSFSEK